MLEGELGIKLVFTEKISVSPAQILDHLPWPTFSSGESLLNPIQKPF